GEATWRHGRHSGRQELPEAVKGRLLWGGAGHCARASVSIRARSDALLLCPLVLSATLHQIRSFQEGRSRTGENFRCKKRREMEPSAVREQRAWWES
ncbi:hypothetical protein LEMLEM_LOCUS10425, partial [Lemmus lemmus]